MEQAKILEFKPSEMRRGKVLGWSASFGPTGYTVYDLEGGYFAAYMGLGRDTRIAPGELDASFSEATARCEAHAREIIAYCKGLP